MSAAAVTVGGAGCLRLAQGDNEESTGEPTGVEAASFNFEYRSDRRQLEIKYTGGGELIAGQIQVQSSEAVSATWPQLGSSASRPDEVLATGSTAVLGAEILNWGQPVGFGETIRVIYERDGAPTTLARFAPEIGTRTAESTQVDSETAGSTQTPAESGTVVVDDFEDTQELGWNIISGDRSRIEFTTAAIQGNNALYFTHDSEDTATQISRPIDKNQMSSFSFWYKYNSSNDNQFRLELMDDSDERIIMFQEANSAMRFRDPEKKDEFIQNTIISQLDKDTWYQVRATNIDFSTHTMDASVYSRDGDYMDGVENAGFWNESDEISRIRIHNGLGNNGNPDPVWLDNIIYRP